METGKQEELLERLASEPDGAGLDGAGFPAADRALLAYAVKLTRAPNAVTRADIESLRRHGLTDRAIHDLCAITAYFAFVNRIADGLGVELEE